MAKSPDYLERIPHNGYELVNLPHGGKGIDRLVISPEVDPLTPGSVVPTITGEIWNHRERAAVPFDNGTLNPDKYVLFATPNKYGGNYEVDDKQLEDLHTLAVFHTFGRRGLLDIVHFGTQLPKALGKASEDLDDAVTRLVSVSQTTAVNILGVGIKPAEHEDGTAAADQAKWNAFATARSLTLASPEQPDGRRYVIERQRFGNQKLPLDLNLVKRTLAEPRRPRSRSVSK